MADIITQIRAQPLDAAVKLLRTFPVRVVDIIESQDGDQLTELSNVLAAEIRRQRAALPSNLLALCERSDNDTSIKPFYALGQLNYLHAVVCEARNRYMHEAPAPRFADDIDNPDDYVIALVKSEHTVEELSRLGNKRRSNKALLAAQARVSQLIAVGAVTQFTADGVSDVLYGLSDEAREYHAMLLTKRKAEAEFRGRLELPDELLDGWTKLSTVIRRVLTSHVGSLSNNVGDLMDAEQVFQKLILDIAGGRR